ncbi:antileukoproteinase-like [Balaenoptera musculus]|uniref:Antileukoproteinase-like n=1 Tax=Balaenoptera musculus TaxID=9771 RepID=A0A8B8VFW9_BALMU|nr:antileukoproteinase-like [Balaenoptera musculus]
MKPSSLTVFLVIFAFGFLMPWAVEGGFRGSYKPGTCPFFDRSVKSLRCAPSECQNDWQCPRRQKCCYDYCGRKCMDPIYMSNPDSSGAV